MRIGRVLTFLVVLVFAATSAMAGGFRLPEAGAKAMGMGFAFTAQANDPSAIYFNPAGIVHLEGNNVKVGVTYIRENGADYTGTTPLTFSAFGVPPTFAVSSETQKDLDFFVPNAFWTRKASPNFAYGIGLFVPFGLGQEYENRDTSIFRNQVTKVDIMTFVINPTVAWKINDVLSVGVGIDFMYGKAELAQTGVVTLPPPGPPQLNLFKLDLEGDGTAWGYNFGLLLTPSDNWRVGFSYRSPFKLDIKDGDVDLRDINSTVPFVPGPGGPFTAAQVFGGTSFHTEASTTINMPATAGFGIAYLRDRFTIEADLDFTFWQTFQSLVVDIKGNTPLLPDSVRPEEWENTVGVYVGGEYRVTDPLALRLGFRYDPTPVPANTMSPLLPDADKMYYCVGGGYKYGNWTFDLAYMYVDRKDRTVNNQQFVAPPSLGSGFNGTWKGDAHLVAFDIGVKF